MEDLKQIIERGESQNLEFKEKYFRKRAKSICRKYDVPEPVFSEMGTDFRVEFFRKSPSDSQKTTQKTTQKILDEIQRNPKVSRKELSKICGLSEDGIKYQLTQLKKKNVIQRVGSDKGGYWKILKEE